VYITKTRSERVVETVESPPIEVPLPFTSSNELATQAAKQLMHALLNPQPAGPFCQVGDEEMLALARLAAIFEGALPTRKTDATSPLLEINDNDPPLRVQIAVSPPRVTATHITTPNSHRILIPTPCRAVTPTTPHSMIRRSAHHKNLSNGMLAETVQQENYVLSLPTGPSMRSPAENTKDAPNIIMPEMANAIICPETGKSIRHQELITMLRYKNKCMRSTVNEIHRLYKTNTIRFIRKSDIPTGRKATYG
jgi:hypothetical protein